ncbi:VCBS repeat-containing protein [Bacillus tianshenii]|nr:VCBS repeat-containing protein [Bacillus tianshenii]
MYQYYSRANMTAPMIVAFARGDVTGDGMPDNVYLTGTKTEDSPFIQNITLLVQDGRTGAATSVPLKENAGYNPTLFLGDFNGNRVADILIRINSGGSGAFTYDYLYSFISNTPQLLFDSNDYNEQYQYEVTYQDNYKVQVISEENNEKYIIDISTRDAEYLNEIYDEDGKLKSPITGFVNPLSGLYPVDFDSNGVFELLAYQKIAGRYNADALGYVLNTLCWKESQFVLTNQNVAIFGVEMSE